MNTIPEVMGVYEVMRWRDMIKYPNLISGAHRNCTACLFEATLDTLSELIPMYWCRDRLGTWISWLNRGRSAGLISDREFRSIQYELIHGCGGL